MALKAIQSGQKTLVDTVASMTIEQGTDTGFDTVVDATKTILLCSIRTVNGSVDGGAGVAWELTDGTTITVTRTQTSGDVVVEWQLIEFSSGVVVQPVSVSLSSTASGTAAIAAPSLASDRFIIPSGAFGTLVQNSRRHMGRWVFDSDTQVSVTRTDGFQTVTFHAQVVEFEGASVQTVNVSLTASTLTTHTETIASVVMGRTALFGSGRVGTVSDHGNSVWHFDLDDATTLSMTRGRGDSADFEMTVFIVELPADHVVQRAAFSMASLDTSDTVTISAVEASRAAVHMPSNDPWNGAAKSSRQSSSDLDQILCFLDLASATSVTVNRTSAPNNADGLVQTIEFPEASTGGQIVVTAPNDIQ